MQMSNNPGRGVRQLALRRDEAALRFLDPAHVLHGEGRGRHVLGRHSAVPGAGLERHLPDASGHVHARQGDAEQQQYYVDLFRKVAETPEWKEYLERNALVPDFRSGKEFVEFLTADEQRHKDLMNASGLHRVELMVA